ncbi:MAG: hypothetical protein NT049_06820 [Planctomycetota bacterium]|nr:hypothetical protein [Planctomycetota bacterium]
METRHLQTIAHALVLVAIMLGLIAAALWLRLEPNAFKNEAQAQNTARVITAPGDGIPDAGKQRMLQVELLQAMNQHLADIEKGLRDGSYTVQINAAAKKGAGKESE